MKLILDHKTIIVDGKSTEYPNRWEAKRAIKKIAKELNLGVWENLKKDGTVHKIYELDLH